MVLEGSTNLSGNLLLAPLLMIYHLHPICQVFLPPQSSQLGVKSPPLDQRRRKRIQKLRYIHKPIQWHRLLHPHPK